MGILFLGRLIITMTPDTNELFQVIYYVFGTALTFQGLYLIIRFKMDNRVKLLLEAMLSVGESKSSQGALCVRLMENNLALEAQVSVSL